MRLGRQQIITVIIMFSANTSCQPYIRSTLTPYLVSCSLSGEGFLQVSSSSEAPAYPFQDPFLQPVLARCSNTPSHQDKTAMRSCNYLVLTRRACQLAPPTHPLTYSTPSCTPYLLAGRRRAEGPLLRYHHAPYRKIFIHILMRWEGGFVWGEEPRNVL